MINKGKREEGKMDINKKGFIYKHFLKQAKEEYAQYSYQDMYDKELDIAKPMVKKAYKNLKIAEMSHSISKVVDLLIVGLVIGYVDLKLFGISIERNAAIIPNLRLELGDLEITLGESLGFLQGVILNSCAVGTFAFGGYSLIKSSQAKSYYLKNECYNDLINIKDGKMVYFETTGNEITQFMDKRKYNKIMKQTIKEYGKQSLQELIDNQQQIEEGNLKKARFCDKEANSARWSAVCAMALLSGYTIAEDLLGNAIQDSLSSDKENIEKALGLVAFAALEPFGHASSAHKLKSKNLYCKAEAYRDVMEQKSVAPSASQQNTEQVKE